MSRNHVIQPHLTGTTALFSSPNPKRSIISFSNNKPLFCYFVSHFTCESTRLLK
uniref:Uncharacterized protein n=1 Tax=Rhizophora mucronata TaxID=61149 RepID=A0A2P2N6D3_RHIMU